MCFAMFVAIVVDLMIIAVCLIRITVVFTVATITTTRIVMIVTISGSTIILLLFSLILSISTTCVSTL